MMVKPLVQHTNPTVKQNTTTNARFLYSQYVKNHITKLPIKILIILKANSHYINSMQLIS